MKSENIIWLALFVLFSVLFGLEIYLWKYYETRMDMAKSSSGKDAVQTSILSYEETTESTTEQITEVINEMNNDDNISKNYKYIFVGDSRYVEMEKYAEENDTFIAENGVGYVFLINHMNEIVSLADSDTKIVVGLGVNDILIGSGEYKSLLTELDERTDAEVYYMLINPVDDDICSYVGYQVTNKMIDEFNTKLEDDLLDTNIKIIDANSYLKESGYTSFDGLHYSDETSEKIYKYLKEELSSN